MDPETREIILGVRDYLAILGGVTLMTLLGACGLFGGYHIKERLEGLFGKESKRPKRKRKRRAGDIGFERNKRRR